MSCHEKRFKFEFEVHAQKTFLSYHWDFNRRPRTDELEMNAIFHRISTGINSEELLLEMRELLVIFGIDDANATHIIGSAETNLAWLSGNVNEMRIFLIEYFKERNSSPSSARSSLISCLSLFVARLVFNWIMQN